MANNFTWWREFRIAGDGRMAGTDTTNRTNAMGKNFSSKFAAVKIRNLAIIVVGTFRKQGIHEVRRILSMLAG
jgi:hypothetical protein